MIENVNRIELSSLMTRLGTVACRIALEMGLIMIILLKISFQEYQHNEHVWISIWPLEVGNLAH